MNTEDAAYFTDNYPDYERQTSPAKLTFYMNLVNRWLEKGQRLFEIGVGQGHFLEKASQQYDCSGCDVNEYGLKITRQKVPSGELRLGSYESIPEDPKVHAVIAWDVLEHISKLDEALSVIYSRLEKAGFLIGIVPVYDGPLGWLVRRLDHDPTHVHKLSRKDWRDKLKKYNFQIVAFGGVIRKLMWSRWYLHLTWPQFLLRPIGSAYYFVAQKR